MSSASYLRLKCTLNFNVSDLYAVLQVNEPTASLDKEKKERSGFDFWAEFKFCVGKSLFALS